MDGVKFIICMVFVFSLGICGDRSVEAQNSQKNNECFTPNDLNGNCINIKRCPSLLFLLENQRQNVSIATFLRNSMCGYEGKDPKVCCPLPNEPTLPTYTTETCGQSNCSHDHIIGGNPTDLECFTPNDLNGNCINIKRCPSLLFLLENQRQNVSIATFLRNSMCGFEGIDPKVCCPLPSEPTLPTYTTETPQGTTNHNPDTLGSAIYETVSSIKLPSQKTCGRSNSSHIRIFGGNPAELGAWPWMAVLGYQYLNISTTNWWLCGGALISDTYVLTAAHCTVGTGNLKLAVVRLGDLNLDPKVNDRSKPIDVAIKRVITHEWYKLREYVNDIALLKLENSVTFNQYIQPICLPIFSHHRADKLVNSISYVAGWGSTSYQGPLSDALMEIQVPVLDNSECKRAFAANNKSIIDDRVMCVGYLTGGKDSCQGDSGGPLMWPSGSQYYLVGVVSFGHKCGEPGYPGVYTRVTSFVEWIVDNMNNS